MTETKKLEGLILFWVNLYPDMGQDTRETLEMLKETNKPLIDQMIEERYVFLFVPTFKEATRIEKIDYDGPYPRCKFKTLDVQVHGLQDDLKKKNIFQPEVEASKLRGIITLFINFHPETDYVNIPETLKLIKEINKEALDRTEEDGRFKVLIVPTTKEGSRIEKIDWDFPFPRLVPAGPSKASKPVVAVVEEDKEDEDEIDEDGDE